MSEGGLVCLRRVTYLFLMVATLLGDWQRPTGDASGPAWLTGPLEALLASGATRCSLRDYFNLSPVLRPFFQIV